MIFGLKGAQKPIRSIHRICAIFFATISLHDSQRWSQGDGTTAAHPYRSLLLQAVFDVWEAKRDAVLDEAQLLVRESEVQGGMNPAESTMSVRNAALAWKTRAVHAPRKELLEMSSSNIPAGELNILNTLRDDLVNDPTSNWLQNIQDEWTSANGGRSDTTVMLAENQKVKIGLMYIGANNTYPVHAHTALEIYHIIAGEVLTTDASNKTEGLVRRKPGEMLMVEPSQLHGLRTEKEAVLILWLWVGDFSGYWFSKE